MNILCWTNQIFVVSMFSHNFNHTITNIGNNKLRPCRSFNNTFKTNCIYESHTHNVRNLSAKCLQNLQFVSLNVLQRQEQFRNTCNVVYPPGLQNPIRAYKTAQSISPIVLQGPKQFWKACKVGQCFSMLRCEIAPLTLEKNI